MLISTIAISRDPIPKFLFVAIYISPVYFDPGGIIRRA
jgi:hypothetical protein